jgi:hypothetical protein
MVKKQNKTIYVFLEIKMNKKTQQSSTNIEILFKLY